MYAMSIDLDNNHSLLMFI